MALPGSFRWGGDKPSMGDVLDHLFRNAKKQGAIAVHGRMEPKFMQDFTNRCCFFYRLGGWKTAHSRNPELVSLIHSGDAFLSRLEGEWCLAFGKHPEGQRQEIGISSASKEIMSSAWGRRCSTPLTSRSDTVKSSSDLQLPTFMCL